MNQTLIARYQPGGDLYAQIVAKWGQDAADGIAAAANTGDATQVQSAYAQYTTGLAVPLNTSTASILYQQLITDPLAAPLAGVENIAANSLLDFFKSPAVLLIIAVVLFVALGGFSFLKRQLAKR